MIGQIPSGNFGQLSRPLAARRDCSRNPTDQPDASSEDPQVQTLTCNAGDVTFPSLDKSCTTPSDCVIAVHQTDCCGNSIAVGIHADSAEAFFAAEAECATLFPACGCPASPAVAEDGQSAGPSQISVECENNRCVTFVETG